MGKCDGRCTLLVICSLQLVSVYIVYVCVYVCVRARTKLPLYSLTMKI